MISTFFIGTYLLFSNKVFTANSIIEVIKMASTNTQLLAATLIAVVAVAAVVIYFTTRPIHSTGTIRAIGIDVFSDAAATVPLNNIDWGVLSPNAFASVVCFIKNTQNVNVTLSLSSANYVPANANQFLFLSWNYTNVILPPIVILPTKLTLQVSPNIVGITTFSFDITINATSVG